MTQHKILIADDEPNILISLEYLMQREGFDGVCWRVTARKPWTPSCAGIRPRLVLLDVMMPRQDRPGGLRRRCVPIEALAALQGTVPRLRILMLMLQRQGPRHRRGQGPGPGCRRLHHQAVLHPRPWWPRCGRCWPAPPRPSRDSHDSHDGRADTAARASARAGTGAAGGAGPVHAGRRAPWCGPRSHPPTRPHWPRRWRRTGRRWWWWPWWWRWPPPPWPQPLLRRWAAGAAAAAGRRGAAAARPAAGNHHHPCWPPPAAVPRCRAWPPASPAWRASVTGCRPGIDAAVARASHGVAQERNRLAALMSELSQSVVVCNLDGRVLLYNQRARQQMQGLAQGPQDAPLPDSGAALIGLGRSIHSVLDRALVAHALAGVPAAPAAWRSPAQAPSSSPPPAVASCCGCSWRRCGRWPMGWRMGRPTALPTGAVDGAPARPRRPGAGPVMCLCWTTSPAAMRRMPRTQLLRDQQQQGQGQGQKAVAHGRAEHSAGARRCAVCTSPPPEGTPVTTPRCIPRRHLPPGDGDRRPGPPPSLHTDAPPARSHR